MGSHLGQPSLFGAVTDTEKRPVASTLLTKRGISVKSVDVESEVLEDG